MTRPSTGSRSVHDVAARTVLVRRGDHLVAVNLSDRDADIALGADAAGVEVLLAWDDATAVHGTSVRVPARSATVLGPA